MDTTVHITGLEALTRKLQNLQGIVTTQKADILNIIATKLDDSTKRAFRATADPNTGTAWKEWSPGYVRYLKKIKKYGKTRKLYFSHRLFESILNGIKEEQSLAYIGSKVKYAPIHQFGFRGTVNIGPYTVRAHKVKTHIRNGKRIKKHIRGPYTVKAHSRNRNIPARPYLGLDKQARTEIVTNIAKRMLQALRS